MSEWMSVAELNGYPIGFPCPLRPTTFMGTFIGFSNKGSWTTPSGWFVHSPDYVPPEKTVNEFLARVLPSRRDFGESSG